MNGLAVLLFMPIFGFFLVVILAPYQPEIRRVNTNEVSFIETDVSKLGIQ